MKEKALKKIPILWEKKENCCGCTACVFSCPKNAIKLVTDEIGFWYPYINSDNCIRCYRCLKVCPLKEYQCE